MIYISLGLDGKNADAMVPMLANGALIESASKNYEHFRKYKVIIPIGPNMVDGELNLPVYLSPKDFYVLYYIDLQCTFLLIERNCPSTDNAQFRSQNMRKRKLCLQAFSFCTEALILTWTIYP